MPDTTAEDIDELVGHVEAWDGAEQVRVVLDGTAALIGIEIAAGYTDQHPDDAAHQFLEAFRAGALALAGRLEEVGPELAELARTRAVERIEQQRVRAAEDRADAGPEAVKETAEEARSRRAQAIAEYRERRRADDERLDRLRTTLSAESTFRAFNDRVVLTAVAGRPSGLRFDERWFRGARPGDVADEILALCRTAAESHETGVTALRRRR